MACSSVHWQLSQGRLRFRQFRIVINHVCTKHQCFNVFTRHFETLWDCGNIVWSVCDEREKILCKTVKYPCRPHCRWCTVGILNIMHYSRQTYNIYDTQKHIKYTNTRTNARTRAHTWFKTVRYIFMCSQKLTFVTAKKISWRNIYFYTVWSIV